MDFIIGGLKNFIEIISKISIIAIPLITYFKYVYSLKFRNKKLKVSSPEIEALKTCIEGILIFPFISFYLQILPYLLLKDFFEIKDLTKNNSMSTIQAIIMIMIVLFILRMGIDYIKDYKMVRKNCLLIETWRRKVYRIIYKNIISILIIIVSIFLSLALLLTSNSIIIKFFEKESLGEDALFYMLALLVWLIALKGPYNSLKTKLQKEVKTVRIYYNQNGKLKIASGIDYKNFYVNRKFVTFYSTTDKIKSIIPAENLVKLEYLYHD